MPVTPHYHTKLMFTSISTLVGNMIDCHGKPRAVTTREASERAQQLGVDYIEASSLENINIDKV